MKKNFNLLNIYKTFQMDKAKETCIEIFSQRNYDITEIYDDHIIGIKKDKEQICVFFVNDPKFNTERTQEYICLMNKMEIKHSIIIYKDTITASAKKIIDNLPSLEDKSDDNIFKLKVELFREDELQFNITKHYLQPTFECLETKEAIKFKKEYGIKFPIMMRTDPIARFYGYKTGNIIKITSKLGFVSFRIVI